MRHLFLPLVLVLAAACSDGPTKPDAATKPQNWGGHVTFAQTLTGILDTKIAWEGNVFWTFDSADLGGTPVHFVIASGQVSIKYSQTTPCTAQGSATSAEVAVDPQHSSTLVVKADGTYTGNFHAEATFKVTTHCEGIPDGPDEPVIVALDLVMSGSADGLSIKGTMTPVVAGTTKYTGTWDFAPLTFQ